MSILKGNEQHEFQAAKRAEQSDATTELQIKTQEPSGIELAKKWVDLLEGNHYIVPAPLFTRTELLQVAKDLVALHGFAMRYLKVNGGMMDINGLPSLVSETRISDAPKVRTFLEKWTPEGETFNLYLGDTFLGCYPQEICTPLANAIGTALGHYRQPAKRICLDEDTKTGGTGVRCDQQCSACQDEDVMKHGSNSYLLPPYEGPKP